jgi:hypothetical protein
MFAVRRDIDRYAGRFSKSEALVFPPQAEDRSALAFSPPVPPNTA